MPWSSASCILHPFSCSSTFRTFCEESPRFYERGKKYRDPTHASFQGTELFEILDPVDQRFIDPDAGSSDRQAHPSAGLLHHVTRLWSRPDRASRYRISYENKNGHVTPRWLPPSSAMTVVNRDKVSGKGRSVQGITVRMIKRNECQGRLRVGMFLRWNLRLYIVFRERERVLIVCTARLRDIIDFCYNALQLTETIPLVCHRFLF